MKPEKMKLVMWDIIRADVYVQDLHKKQDSENDTLVARECQQLVFYQHRITREQFNRSYQYYQAHKDVMKNLLDSIASMQQKKQFVPFNQN